MEYVSPTIDSARVIEVAFDRAREGERVWGRLNGSFDRTSGAVERGVLEGGLFLSKPSFLPDMENFRPIRFKRESFELVEAVVEAVEAELSSGDVDPE